MQPSFSNCFIKWNDVYTKELGEVFVNQVINLIAIAGKGKFDNNEIYLVFHCDASPLTNGKPLNYRFRGVDFKRVPDGSGLFQLKAADQIFKEWLREDREKVTAKYGLLSGDA